MAVPEIITFEVRKDKRGGIVLGVELRSFTYANRQANTQVANPLQLLNLPQDQWGHWPEVDMVNTPFKAIISFETASTKNKNRGLDVKLVEQDIWYPILPAELIKIVKQCPIINGYANGRWQVVKLVSGYSLSLIEPLPLPFSFEE